MMMGVTAVLDSGETTLPAGRAAHHDVRVPLALAMALHLIAAADAPCWFVGNTRIVRLPSARIGPREIEALTEEPSPSRTVPLPPRLGPGRWRTLPPQIAVRGNEELEQRLQEAERGRVGAEAARIAAEQKLDQALRQLKELRRRLANARARLRRARDPAEHQVEAEAHGDQARAGAPGAGAPGLKLVGATSLGKGSGPPE